MRKKTKTKALAYRENLFIFVRRAGWARGLRSVLFLLLLLPHLFTYTTRFCFVLLLCLVLFFFPFPFFLLSASSKIVSYLLIFLAAAITQVRGGMKMGKTPFSLSLALSLLSDLLCRSLCFSSSPFFLTCDFLLAFCCAVHERVSVGVRLGMMVGLRRTAR
jgi:hypothetical protein